MPVTCPSLGVNPLPGLPRIELDGHIDRGASDFIPWDRRRGDKPCAFVLDGRAW